MRRLRVPTPIALAVEALCVVLLIVAIVKGDGSSIVATGCAAIAWLPIAFRNDNGK